jgi:hypothetical protein
MAQWRYGIAASRMVVFHEGFITGLKDRSIFVTQAGAKDSLLPTEPERYPIL